MKQAVASITALMLVASASVPAYAIQSDQEDSLKIAVLSDTHYLSPAMIKDTQDYTDHLNSDRKMFTESSAILEEMFDTIQKDKPDVLMISGDLTKDGEKEGHESMAAQLEQLKEEVPGLDVYVVPGNHDVRNSNAMNFNTEDGAAVPAGRTQPEDFKKIYADAVYNDDSVIATYTPPQGKEAGGLSYVAQPKEGFTVIAIDSARYSADNTDAGKDEHETSGAISADLEQWVLSQIAAAKQRGDTVIGLQHHGVIAHFGMEPDILPMYLVNDYERLSTEFADAGMRYIFTGHMHANDISSMTTEAGNILYDIETGSAVTYPSPMRYVTLDRDYNQGDVTETMSVETKTHLGPITFQNPVTGEEQTIDDITDYGQQHGFSNQMLTTTVNGFLHDYYSQIAQSGGIKLMLEELLNSLLGDSLPIDNITIEKLIDVALPLLLPDGQNGESLYYDSTQGGIVIKQKVSILDLNVVIPSEGLKQTLNVLFDKLDQEIQNPVQLDAIVGKLVDDLVSIPVAEDKTLLDYVNYIYQSHLGGLDNGNWPDWVQSANEKLEAGQLLQEVVEVLISNVSDALNNVLKNLPLKDVLGATAWDNKSKVFVALEGRTPLVRPFDQSGETALSLALGFLGAKWPSDPDNKQLYLMPEGSNPEIGYSIADFLDALSKYFTLDIQSLLKQLINGTLADPDTGAEATEGILTQEWKDRINGWLLNLVTSMGKDGNYPEDNNTVISVQWKLSDYTALQQLIQKAEVMDLSGYTKETADAFTNALSVAKNLPDNALQSQVDQATADLQAAIDNLEELIDASDDDNQNGDGNQSGHQNQGNGQPDDNQNQNNSGNGTANPDTGDVFPWVVVGILALSSVVVLTRKAKV
nr:metallophosphoesterase [uncultured Solibaculum sp.]